MPSPLETATALLDRETVAGLGDTFTYTPGGGSPVTGVLGFVDYGEDNANPVPAAPGAIGQVTEVELSAALFPTRPNAACRVSNIAKYPGAIWKPIAVRLSASGDWLFGLERVTN